jgi:hypothetical protein
MTQDLTDDLESILDYARERHREVSASGVLQLEMERERTRRSEQARRAEALAKIAHDSACPPEEAELVIQGLLYRTSALDQVRKAVSKGWAQQHRPHPGSKPWILVSGTVGAGKTLSAIWALLRGTLDETGEPWRGERVYVTSREVATLNPNYGPDRERLHALSRATWMVLDDIGYQDAGQDGFLGLAVQHLLNDLHRWRTRVVLGTNLTPQQLDEYIEPPAEAEDGGGPSAQLRLADRLAQLVTPVVTTEDSYRRRSAAPSRGVR